MRATGWRLFTSDRGGPRRRRLATCRLGPRKNSARHPLGVNRLSRMTPRAAQPEQCIITEADSIVGAARRLSEMLGKLAQLEDQAVTMPKAQACAEVPREA